MNYLETRVLKINQIAAEEVNNFILDIDNFYVQIDNYSIKIKINLCILNTELNFVNQIMNVKVVNFGDKITHNYTGNNYFFVRFYKDKENYKLYQLKFIDYNDNNNLKLIYLKLN